MLSPALHFLCTKNPPLTRIVSDYPGLSHSRLRVTEYVWLYVSLFVSLFECLFVCLSVCLFVGVFVCMFVCFFVCLFVCMFVCIFVCLYVIIYNISLHVDTYFYLTQGFSEYSSVLYNHFAYYSYETLIAIYNWGLQYSHYCFK